jgi:hypothetical protein
MVILTAAEASPLKPSTATQFCFMDYLAIAVPEMAGIVLANRIMGVSKGLTAK